MSTPAAATRPRHRELWQFLEYVGLCGLAIAQPALDVLSHNSDYLVTAGITAAAGITLALLAVTVPPLVCYGIERLAGIAGARPRIVVRTVIVWLLAAAWATRLVRQSSSLEPWLVTAAAIIVASGVAFAISRFKPARTFARLLAWGPIAYVTIFLAFSPASAVFFPDAATDRAATEFQRTPPIVFVLFDEFPITSLLDGSGRIDRELFPNFARLADRSTWYRNTTTAAGFTQGAVPALLTGDYPKAVGTPPTVGEYPDNLFTLLQPTYRLNVHESVTRLCPSQQCTNFESGGFGTLVRNTTQLWFDGLRPTRTQTTRRFDDANAWKFTRSSADEFLESLQPHDHPTLDFLHIQLPHYPWRFDQQLRAHRYVPGEPPGEHYLGTWTEPSLSTARQRHFLQMQAADTYIGKVLDRLASIGTLDDTMLVVTADHGISMRPGEPSRNITATNAPDIMWTPLFVQYPGTATARVDDRPAWSLDVVPTVLDTLGASGNRRFDGRSLRGAPRSDNERKMKPWTWFSTPADLQPDPDDFVTVDGRSGFATVRAARAVAAGPDPALRIYRDHPWGSFIGGPAGTNLPGTPGTSVRLDNRSSYNTVDLRALDNDWAWSIATFAGVAPGTPVALVTNGTVAATCTTVSGNGSSECAFVVPPNFLHDGRNDIRVVRIDVERKGLTEITLDPATT